MYQKGGVILGEGWPGGSGANGAGELATWVGT